MNDNEITVEDQREIDEFWRETGRDAVRSTRSRQEEAAKQIISITSVMQAIYFAAISFSDLKTALMPQIIHVGKLIVVVVLFISPIIIWIISLGFAIRVAVPVMKVAKLNSPGQLSKLYVETVGEKAKYLRHAHKALVLGFVPLVINIILYLCWV